MLFVMQRNIKVVILSDKDYENLLRIWLGSMIYGKQVDWTKWHLPMAQAYGVLVDLREEIV